MSEFEEMFDEEIPFTEEDRFHIDDDKTAEWAINQIREAEAEKAKWKKFYDERYQVICNECDLTIANMKSLLQSYLEKVPHKVTKTEESYTLPSGKIYLKKQDPDFDFKGNKKFLEWLHENKMTDFIKTTEEPKWGDFKKKLAKDPEGNFAVIETEEGLMAVTTDGEPIPVKVTLKPAEFKVQLNKED